MNLTELTIRLLLLFFPGLIAALLINNLTTHKRPDFNVYILHSFILGMLSYFVANLLLLLNNWYLKMNGFQSNGELSFFQSLTDNTVSISYKEVVVVTVIAFILAIIISLILNRGWFHWLARKAKITNQFGEGDVWQYLFNSPDIGWITVRDLETDLVYQGYVSAFSDTHQENELLLGEVHVYDGKTAEFLYELKMLYINRDLNKITIEIQKTGENRND